MIKNLHIKNYAIINEIDVEFDNGYIAFTGETGAGKSIIIGALTCLSGGRADSSIIKKGADKAIIEGVFTPTERTNAILLANDYDVEDELIVRRTITQDGKNSIRVNGNIVNLSFLNMLLKDEIDIHSQKENTYLLNAKCHLQLLDNYLANPDLLAEYTKAYKEYKMASDKLDDFCNTEFSLKDLDYYQYALDELKDANLSLNEEVELEEKEQAIKQRQKSLSSIMNAINLYEEDHGIKDQLFSLKKLVGDSDDLSDLYEKLNDIYYNLEDEMGKIKSEYTDFDLSLEELDIIEQRLFVINRLKRKYQMDINGLLNYQKELDLKISQFENREAYIEKQTAHVKNLLEIADKQAKNLSKIRKTKAKEVEKAVIAELNELMLPNARFEVAFKNKSLSGDGIDDVQFLISLNKGEDLKPLVKVVSGGEISRVMLGLKTIFSRLNKTSLLVFDEIDSGVSGQVAFTVGKKMKKIAENCQVISITHLAPVAAFAKQHLFIYKKDANGSTNTHIRELDYNERINELAMISSSIVNEQSCQAAKELLERAENAV